MAAKQPAPSRGRPDRPGRPRARWWLAITVALFAVNYLAATSATRAPARVHVPYSPFFVRQIEAGNVAEITSKGTAIQGTFKQPERYRGSTATTRFATEIPEFADTEALARSLARAGVLVNVGPTLLFLALLIGLSRRGASAQSLLGSFGRSNARRYAPGGNRVTFADVAGIDEAKAELAEVVDFLRRPERYRKLGGRIPHGVLLSGEPGTGKDRKS